MATERAILVLNLGKSWQLTVEMCSHVKMLNLRERIHERIYNMLKCTMATGAADGERVLEQPRITQTRADMKADNVNCLGKY